MIEQTASKERQQRLEHAIALYLEAVDAGQKIDIAEWIDRYPDLTPEINDFIVDHERIDRVFHASPRDTKAVDNLTTSVGTPNSNGQANAPSKQPLDNNNRQLGDYQLLQEIGRGGMGVVYRARQSSVNRDVAVKVVRLGLHCTSEELQRLRNEAEAAARLDHPAIVPIYEVGQSAENYYFSMKLIEGGSLADRLTEFRGDYQAIARLIITVAEAVAHAHRRGVLHRDLKPSNILIDGQLRPFVADLGLSRRMDTDSGLTQTGEILGTPSYMAPEQASGAHDAVTTATDVYGIGTILYCLLAGEPPFRGDSILTTLQQVREESVRMPRSVDRQIPRDLESICLKCLEKEPSRRYPSAESVLADVKAFRDGRPITARRTSASTKMWFWCRRNPVVATLLATIIVGLSVSALWLRSERDVAVLNLDRAVVAEDKAVAAERSTKTMLLDSLVNQARAQRVSGKPGRRFGSMEALRQATQLANELNLPTDERYSIRNEWIASTALFDIQAECEWPGTSPISEQVRVAFDANVDRYAWLEAEGITVRRMADNAILHRFKPLGNSLRRSISRFSPDGSKLAAFGIGDDQIRNRIMVWDLNTRKCLLDIEGHGQWYNANLDFSPDSQWLVSSGRNGSVRLHDLANEVARRSEPTVIATQAGNSPRCMRFSPDGGTVAVAHAGGVEIIDLASRKSIVFDFADDHGRSIAWQPNSRRLATTELNQLVLIDVDSGNIARLDDSQQVRTKHLFFHPRGELLGAAGDDHLTRFWNVNTGKLIMKAPNAGVAFGDDGQSIAWGTAGAGVGRWRTAYSEYVTELPTMGVKQIAVSANGTRVAAIRSNDVLLWDSRQKVEVATLPIRSHFVQFATDRFLCVSSSAGVSRWLNDGSAGEKLVWDRTGNQLSQRVIAMSADARVIATTGDNKLITIRDQTTGGEIERLQRDKSCTSSSFTPNGELLAMSGRRERVVKVWHAESNEIVAELPVAGTASTRFSTDGKWLVTNDPVRLQIWEAGTWKRSHSIDKPMSARHEPMAFTNDGILAYLSATDKVQFMDVASGERLAEFEQPSDEPITGIAVSDNGATLAVLTIGGSVLIWEVRSLRTRMSALEIDRQ